MTEFEFERVEVTAQGNRCGESHPRARLTWVEVELMRDLREDHDLSIRVIAEKFGYAWSTVRDVVTYRTWAEQPIIVKRLVRAPD